MKLVDPRARLTSGAGAARNDEEDVLAALRAVESVAVRAALGDCVRVVTGLVLVEHGGVLGEGSVVAEERRGGELDDA